MIAALFGVQLILGALAWGSRHVHKSIVPIHKWLGILLLILLIPRLIWRLGHTPPPLPVSMSVPERFLAKGAHAALQGLSLLLPVTGLALLYAPARTMRIVGLLRHHFWLRDDVLVRMLPRR